jgi:hypothetical protein
MSDQQPICPFPATLLHTLRWAYTLSQCAASGSSSIGSATLTLSQVYVLFFIVAIGLGIASVVVILERLAGAAGKTQVRSTRPSLCGRVCTCLAVCVFWGMYLLHHITPATEYIVSGRSPAH